jgi:hypothetical protein
VDHVGVHRKPQFADGGTAMERMTHYLRPGYFAHEVTGFTNARRLLVERAGGEWTFTPDLNGAWPCAGPTTSRRSRAAACWCGC